MIYQYQERSYRSRRRRSSFLKKFAVILFFCVVVYGILTTSYTLLRTFSTNPTTQKIISPLGKILPMSISRGLEETVEEQLEGTSGTYAVAIKNLKTGEMYLKNEHRQFEAASLYKLWIMLTVMQQLDEGKLKESQALNAKAEDLNKTFRIATEAAEIKEGEIKMTVDEALNRMITISHNYAALLLSAKVRLSNVKTQMEQYSFTESHLNPPRTTASDILAFYEKLYKGELVSKTRSEEMIDILKKQQLNDRIPLYLPDEITSAHKTGELGPFKHDAGIVFTDRGDYIIVLLSESSDPKAAAQREARISEAVYQYFQKE
jgi:beta-lactamase class A